MEKEGIIKLADFGTSQIKTLSKSDVGTPRYWAPEVIRAEEYSFKADIW
jgi:serine/threonine protein kinase